MLSSSKPGANCPGLTDRRCLIKSIKVSILLFSSMLLNECGNFVQKYTVGSYRHFLLLLLPLTLGLAACKGQQKSEAEEPKEYKYYADWSINLEYMEAGCNGGYDCIQSIDKPMFITVPEVDFLQDNDLVVGIKMGDEVRCYPHPILDWHEIVNDEIDGTLFSINYCPLTGSAMAWDRHVNGKITEFGVSGLLFNSNVIPYDRETGSHWSQMKQQCINGEFYRQRVKSYPVLETTWATWKKMYPNSKVLSTETGFTRDYGNYPYLSYKENEDVYFPTEFDTDSIHPKLRVYGVINGDDAVGFRYDYFAFGPGVRTDTAFGKPVIIVGSEPDNFMAVFSAEWKGQPLQVKLTANEAPALFGDDKGNRFDMFGYCIKGPDAGKRLEVLNGFAAYWFAWAAFYPGIPLN